MHATPIVINHGQCFRWTFPDGQTLAWSIDAAKKVLAESGRAAPLTASHADMAQMLERNFMAGEIDDAYAMTTNTDDPPIAIVSPRPNAITEDAVQLLLIDGWHRIRKGYLTNLPEMKIQLLLPGEEQRCRVTVL